MRLKLPFGKASFTQISIHAPIVGCDVIANALTPEQYISIHAPIVGCDPINSDDVWRRHEFQSTHPSWGATCRKHADYADCNNFNPRTHRGVRHWIVNFIRKADVFQSTHPSWGATPSLKQCATNSEFQSTHPSWGATMQNAIELGKAIIFQSTHPSWGATIEVYLIQYLTKISIHAPIVGCDGRAWLHGY